MVSGSGCRSIEGRTLRTKSHCLPDLACALHNPRLRAVDRLPICLRVISFLSDEGLSIAALEHLSVSDRLFVIVGDRRWCDEHSSSSSPWAARRTYFSTGRQTLADWCHSGGACGDLIVAESPASYFFGGPLFQTTGARNVVVSFHTLSEFATATALIQMLRKAGFSAMAIHQEFVPDLDVCASGGTQSLEVLADAFRNGSLTDCPFATFIGQPDYPFRHVAHILLHDPPRVPFHREWTSIGQEPSLRRDTFIRSLESVNSGSLFASLAFGAFCIHSGSSARLAGTPNLERMSLSSLVCVDSGNVGSSSAPWSHVAEQTTQRVPELQTNELVPLLKSRGAASHPSSEALSEEEVRFLRSRRRFRSRAVVDLQRFLTFVSLPSSARG